MTAPNPNGAGPQTGPDMGRVAQRAAQNAASSVGDMALVAALAQEQADIYIARCAGLERDLANKCAELDAAVREKDAELARARATITALEAEAGDADGDGADDVDPDTSAAESRGD